MFVLKSVFNKIKIKSKIKINLALQNSQFINFLRKRVRHKERHEIRYYGQKLFTNFCNLYFLAHRTNHFCLLLVCLFTPIFIFVSWFEIAMNGRDPRKKKHSHFFSDRKEAYMPTNISLPLDLSLSLTHTHKLTHTYTQIHTLIRIDSHRQTLTHTSIYNTVSQCVFL